MNIMYQGKDDEKETDVEYFQCKRDSKQEELSTMSDMFEFTNSETIKIRHKTDLSRISNICLLPLVRETYYFNSPFSLHLKGI